MASEKKLTPYGAMSASLNEGRLADLCLADGVQTGPFGSQLHQEDYVQDGTPIITVEHLGENRIVHQDLPCVSDADKQRLNKYSLQTGDIVFSRVGSVDRRAIVRETENGWLFSGRCLRVRPNPRKLDPQWLSYFFGLPSFKQYIRGIAVGATMPSINTKILSDVPIYFPDIDQQRKVAKLLTSLDEKIDLNRRINQTLEAMAQAIFQSWFVDFDPIKAKIAANAEGRDPLRAAMSVISGKTDAELDALPPEQYEQLAATAALFPHEMEASELEEIPKGWNAGVFKDCCLRVESGGTPSRKDPKFWGGKIPWLTSGEVRDVVVLDTKESITRAGLDSSSAKLWPAMSTVVAMYGATAGQVCLIANEMTANQACCALIPKDAFKTFVFIAARQSIQQLAEKASGSAQQNLNKGLVERHGHVIPDEGVAERFELTTNSLLQKWVSNQREIAVLAELRDTLLPKLLSGELSVEALTEPTGAA